LLLDRDLLSEPTIYFNAGALSSRGPSCGTSTTSSWCPAASSTAREAEEEALVLLIEPVGTPNTGSAGGDMSAEPDEL
jgi:hypothetical protein